VRRRVITVVGLALMIAAAFIPYRPADWPRIVLTAVGGLFVLWGLAQD